MSSFNLNNLNGYRIGILLSLIALIAIIYYDYTQYQSINKTREKLKKVQKARPAKKQKLSSSIDATTLDRVLSHKQRTEFGSDENGYRVAYKDLAIKTIVNLIYRIENKQQYRLNNLHLTRVRQDDKYYYDLTFLVVDRLQQ